MKKKIFPIAIGTFGLGADRNESWDESIDSFEIKDEDMEALLYSYSIGQNYIEISHIYAGGKTMKFIGEFLKRVDREKLFITVKIEKYINKVEDIETQLDKYLNILGIEYADSILIHVPSAIRIPFEDCYNELKRMVSIGKAKNISASNLNINQLKQIVEEFNIKLYSYEGLYNLECKNNEDVGIIDYCHEHNVLFVNYQPLRRNRTANRNYPELVELAKKYNKTQNQILLNWYIKEKKILPIIKSGNIERIKENIEAMMFEMEKEDYATLNSFRSKEFESIEVDWKDNSGIPIYKLANQFE